MPNDAGVKIACPSQRATTVFDLLNVKSTLKSTKWGSDLLSLTKSLRELSFGKSLLSTTKGIGHCFLPKLLLELQTNNKQLSNIVYDVVRQLQCGQLESVFCLLFLSELISSAFFSHISTLSVTRGFSIAYQTIITHRNADFIGVKLLWSNSQQVLDIVRTRLFSHGCLLHESQNAFSQLTTTVLKAFLSSASLCEENILTPSLNVQYLKVVGMASMECELLEDTLVMDISIPRLAGRQQHTLRQSVTSSGLLVALFDCNLEIPTVDNFQHKIELHETYKNGCKSLEDELLDRFAHMLQRCGVTLVVCQQRVHPHLVNTLSRRRICCLPRVSSRYMSALQRLSGAKVFGAMPVLSLDGTDPVIGLESMGCLRSVRREYYYGKAYMTVCGFGNDCSRDELVGRLYQEFSSVLSLEHTKAIVSRMSRFSTMFLTACSSDLCAQFQWAVEDTMRTLWRLLRNPVVVEGHEWLRGLANNISSVCALNKPTDTLAETDMRLQMSRSRGQIHRAIDLYCAALRKCASHFSPADVNSNGSALLFEYEGCMEALRAATQLTLQLLDIDEVVHVGPVETNC